MPERLLYTSFVDVSLPYGPGINERAFLADLLPRYGNNLHAVIPMPSRGMPVELRSLTTTFISRTSVRKLAGWLQARTTGAAVLLRSIRRFHPDLVVIRAGAFSFSHALIARAGIPFVLKTAGDLTHEAFYQRRIAGRLLKKVDQGMLDTLLEKTLAVDVVSHAHKEAIVGRYPHLEQRVHVIDNGVDLNMFGRASAADCRRAQGFADGDIVLGYVGNYPMRRGGKEVIAAVAALRSRMPVKGLVVGDGGEADECRRFAEVLGVGDAVVVAGEVEYAKVPEFMAAMDVALSILRPNERHESEQKVRQYLACGLSVVGTAGSNDFLRGYSFARVVQTENTEEIVAAVISLLDRGQAGLAELRSRARRFAESTLSVSSRNDHRLREWTRALASSTAPDATVALTGRTAEVDRLLDSLQIEIEPPPER
ncbi:MAG: glycosyltransferase [Gemmatimonadota bacterium]